MTVPQIKVKVVRRPQIKVKALVKFPAKVVTQNFLTVTSANGTYTFSVDYTRLGPGPVVDPTTAFVAVFDQTSGSYKEVTLASLLTSGLDADLQAIAALAGAGILVKTAANTWAFRTATGTANEITVTNGDGVAGNPTFSLPTALTFTGKTITGGTYASAGTYNKVTITAPATAATLTLIDGTTLTGPAASGTVMTLGNNETVTGVKTFGAAGNVGKLVVAGTTSGSTILNATAIASGTLTLPAATDTLVGKATTDILTNKTYDTAGAGNSFSINSVVANANTGTGAVVRATSPVLVTPALGTPTALVLTSATGLPLSGLTTQAAFTFVGNNTSGAAIPTAVDIHALTLKASPAGTDEVIISDQAASGAWKRSPVSSLASASGVASLNGLTGAVLYNQYGLINHSLAVSAAGSALTIALKDASGADASATSPVYGNFRSPTGTTGSWVQRSVTAANSLVISSGSTLGVTSATAFRLWVVLFDDAGTMRLGVINCSTSTQIFPLIEGAPASSTAEGGAGAADSAGVIYTGTAVTAKSFLIVGYVEWNTTGLTAGTWTTTNLNFIQSMGPCVKKPGDIIQNYYNSTGSVATGTTIIPEDDTIPQITEGDLYIQQSITPASAANRLVLDASTFGSYSKLEAVTIAFFQDSTANALAAGFQLCNGANFPLSIPLAYEMQAGTISSTTFKVRIGGASAGTFTLNGSASARLYGGAMVSRFRLMELMG